MLTGFNMFLVVVGGHVMRELEALRLQKFNLTSFTSFVVFTHLLVIDNLMKTKSGQHCLFYLDIDHSCKDCLSSICSIIFFKFIHRSFGVLGFWGDRKSVV